MIIWLSNILNIIVYTSLIGVLATMLKQAFGFVGFIMLACMFAIILYIITKQEIDLLKGFFIMLIASILSEFVVHHALVNIFVLITYILVTVIITRP